MRLLALLATIAFVLPVSPAQDRIKVLLVDGQNNHDWRTTTPILKAILENCGRFTVAVASAAEPAEFRPDFAKYQVVLSNYNGPAWPTATRDALSAFVRGGGGLVIVHAADNSFPEWPEYNEMIGIGGWGGRNEASGPYVRYRDGKVVFDTTPGRGGSHGARHEFLVVTRDPDHAIVRGLPTQWRHTADELYDRMRGPAKRLTVLATAFSDPATGGSGEHEPMLMTIAFGKGRVFHTALGHDAIAMRGVGFQVTLQRGTEWAATGAVTLPPPEGLLSAERAASRDPAAITPASEATWLPLFDGKTLTGWSRHNGTATFAVEDEVIVGTTSDGSPNSFLCTDATYRDFELMFEVKLDEGLNSGVQIRSRTRDGREGRVQGPQVEIATNGNAGFLYAEGLKGGWLSPPRDDAATKAAFHKGEWNRYRILAEGTRIRTWINDVPIADLVDDKTGMAEGFIGLQVHGIGRGKGPYRVCWRNLRLRRL